MLGIILGYAAFVVLYMVFMMANAPRAGDNFCPDHVINQNEPEWGVTLAMHPGQQLDCPELRRPLGSLLENDTEELKLIKPAESVFSFNI